MRSPLLHRFSFAFAAAALGVAATFGTLLALPAETAGATANGTLIATVPNAVAMVGDGTSISTDVYVLASTGVVSRVTQAGVVTELNTAHPVPSPSGIAVDNGEIYVGSAGAPGHIEMLATTGGTPTVFATMPGIQSVAGVTVLPSIGVFAVNGVDGFSSFDLTGTFQSSCTAEPGGTALSVIAANSATGIIVGDTATNDIVAPDMVNCLTGSSSLTSGLSFTFFSVNGPALFLGGPAGIGVYVTGTWLSTPLTVGPISGVALSGSGVPEVLAATGGLYLISPPTAPLNITATPGNHSATISWDPPANNGGFPILGYTVTETGNNALTCSTTTATSCTINGLTNGQSYTFGVVANVFNNQTGDSGASNSVIPDETPTTVAPTTTNSTSHLAATGLPVVALLAGGISAVLGGTLLRRRQRRLS